MRVRLFALFAAALACGTIAFTAIHAAEVRKICPGSASTEYFFPQGSFETKDAFRDEFVREWYSKHLSTMREPSLSCGAAADDEVYRFVWLRTFHAPVSVRISLRDGQATLTTMQLSGMGGYEPGGVIRRIKRKLPQGDWTEIQAALDRSDYWQLPTKVEHFGFDGSQWIMEARRGDTYHLVDRWTPDPGAYRDLGLLFLRFAGYRTDRPDVY